MRVVVRQGFYCNYIVDIEVYFLHMRTLVNVHLYWNGQLVWTPALALYLCVGDRGPGTGDCVQRDLSPTSGYTGISARRRYANFFYLQSVPTRSLSTLVG